MSESNEALTEPGPERRARHGSSGAKKLRLMAEVDALSRVEQGA